MNTILIIHLRRILKLSLTFVLLYGSMSFAQAQVTSSKNKNPFPVKYISDADQKLNIKTLTLAPVYDNVNGIYATPIQNLLIELLQNDKAWGYSAFPQTSKKVFVETYTNNPAEVMNILTASKSQGLITAIITKGPSGISARLNLYTADQGLLLAEESFQDLSTFEIPKLRNEVVTLYRNLKNKLPYRGVVLSRRGIDVTLSAGQMNGLAAGNEVTLAQILKINRHPKLKYMIGVEKEIIGKVQITKVEPYLSFGQITFEKETGVVEVGAKLLPSEFISYPMPEINKDGQVTGDKLVAAIENINNPKKETVQENATAPTDSAVGIGKAILQGSTSQFSESATQNSGSSASSSQSLALGLNLGLELWMSKNWYVDFGVSQSLFKADNSLAGSSPKDLNYTFARYHGAVGYYFLINQEIKSPKFGLEIGYASIKTDVTDTTPRAFSSKVTSGLLLKVTGQFPLEQNPISLGASYDIFLNSKTTDSPISSGSDTTRINSFGVNAIYHSSPTLNYRFDLNFTQVQVDFANGPASGTQSSTVKMTTELFGIEYLF